MSWNAFVSRDGVLEQVGPSGTAIQSARRFLAQNARTLHESVAGPLALAATLLTPEEPDSLLLGSDGVTYGVHLQEADE